MKLFNLGSINIDKVYNLPHLVTAGETIATTDYKLGLGGKGANQSIAAAAGGAEVIHIGAINRADLVWREKIASRGVLIDKIELRDEPTGHAVVMVDQQSGENQIVIFGGTNLLISHDMIDSALDDAKPGDWALTQNETNAVSYFFERASSLDLKLCYSAAPFEAERVKKLLPLTDLLVVNEGEAAALAAELGTAPCDWNIPHLVITLGSKGAKYLGLEGEWETPAPKVDAIDTTGAGDTFLGFMLAALCQNKSMRDAMDLAIAAASLQVTRAGAADAIPNFNEVEAVLLNKEVAK